MRIGQWCKYLAIAAVCANGTAATLARGNEPIPAIRPAPATSALTDVALDSERTLSGQVISSSGAPIGNSAVWAVQRGEVIATAVTDENGWFTLAGMKGGVYQIETANGASSVRVWTSDSAPPAARASALVVSDEQVARGQGIVRRLITNPWVWGVGIATAIAVPVVIAATDDDDKPSGS